MKLKSILLILVSVFFVKSINAQECKGFFPFEPDTKLEMTYYDKKGKVSSSSELTIVDITETDGVVEAEVASVVRDKKGEEVTTGNYRVTCKEGGYEMDFSDMLPPDLLKSSYGMELEITGDALEFPNDLSVGKTLNDATTEIEVRSSDIKIMTMKFDISNRKVEAKESVTTPAGTFECYKISYDLNSKVSFMKKKYHIIQWIAEGVGVVKDETYGKKNKLVSSSKLTKFEKP